MSKVKEFRTKDKRIKEEMDKNFKKIIQEYKKNGDIDIETDKVIYQSHYKQKSYT